MTVGTLRPLRRSEVPLPRRAARMYQRNVMVYRRAWMVIFSGFFEPLFYLLSIGVGLGTMVPPIDGINYTAYVAPGLLASSCMNGAISDGLFNIWWKLNVQHTYDGILGTPMRVADIAFGDSGGGGNDQRALLQQLETVPYDLMIHTGDIAYDHGTLADFEAKFFGMASKSPAARRSTMSPLLL